MLEKKNYIEHILSKRNIQNIISHCKYYFLFVYVNNNKLIINSNDFTRMIIVYLIM